MIFKRISVLNFGGIYCENKNKSYIKFKMFLCMKNFNEIILYFILLLEFFLKMFVVVFYFFFLCSYNFNIILLEEYI